MSEIKLFGIKNCDQVKKARKLLEEKSISFIEVDVRKDGLTRDEIKFWLDKRSLEEVLNKRSKTYKELGLKDQSLSNDDFLNLMKDHPLLFKRPLLVNGNEIYIGNKEIESFI